MKKRTMAIALGLLIVLPACSNSPTDPGDDFDPPVVATGTWTGWTAWLDYVIELDCFGTHFTDDTIWEATFDLTDSNGQVSGGITIDQGAQLAGGPLTGTFDGTSMTVDMGPNAADCFVLECSLGDGHTLCRNDAVFTGMIVNFDSWQGEWSTEAEGNLGKVTISGPFRADR